MAIQDIPVRRLWGAVCGLQHVARNPLTDLPKYTAVTSYANALQMCAWCRDVREPGACHPCRITEAQTGIFEAVRVKDGCASMIAPTVPRFYVRGCEPEWFRPETDAPWRKELTHESMLKVARVDIFGSALVLDAVCSRCSHKPCPYDTPKDHHGPSQRKIMFVPVTASRLAGWTGAIISKTCLDPTVNKDNVFLED